MPMNWAPIHGRFRFGEESIVFGGGPKNYGEETGSAIGLAIADRTFAGGTISADITFHDLEPKSACSIVFWHHPQTQNFVSAGLAHDPVAMFNISHFDNKWITHSAAGDGANLESGRCYHLQLQLQGSRAILSVDGVRVTAASLPFTLSPSQVGIWCRSLHDVTIANFEVTSEVPRVFVVMQFGAPFDELHRDVLKSVCLEFGFDAVRADETFGPGMIVADIEKQIQEAKFIIADITPANPNVYYEVGYARAINKPTILLADRSTTKLPFDVSGFRTLFYDNTIGGKALIEEGLRHHIRAVLNQSTF